MCGGWNPSNNYLKTCGTGRTTGYFTYFFIKTIQVKYLQELGIKNLYFLGFNFPNGGISLVKERGFFSMAAVGKQAYVFGGKSNV